MTRVTVVQTIICLPASTYGKLVIYEPGILHLEQRSW